MSSTSASVPPSDTEQRYRRLLEEHATSGLTRQEFAAKKGVVASTLGWWKCELGRRDRMRAGAADGSLLPVKFVAATFDRSRAAAPDARGCDFVVRLRSGREVRVGVGFDASELARLVEVLEAC
jgi:hypothetical protein